MGEDAMYAIGMGVLALTPGPSPASRFKGG
jgi:hypothetical protein